MASSVKRVSESSPAPRDMAAPRRGIYQLLDLHNEMSRMANRFGYGLSALSPSFERLADTESEGLADFPGGWLAPKVDATESVESYEITAELPGIAEADIDITLADGALIVKGEKKVKKGHDDKDFHVRERSYGLFKRVFRVPDDVDADAIRADFKEGIVSITLPKSKHSEPERRKISVKSN